MAEKLEKPPKWRGPGKRPQCRGVRQEKSRNDRGDGGNSVWPLVKGDWRARLLAVSCLACWSMGVGLAVGRTDQGSYRGSLRQDRQKGRQATKSTASPPTPAGDQAGPSSDQAGQPSSVSQADQPARSASKSASRREQQSKQAQSQQLSSPSAGGQVMAFSQAGNQEDAGLLEQRIEQLELRVRLLEQQGCGREDSGERGFPLRAHPN